MVGTGVCVSRESKTVIATLKEDRAFDLNVAKQDQGTMVAKAEIMKGIAFRVHVELSSLQFTP